MNVNSQFSGILPRSTIPESYESWMFCFLANCQTPFQNACIIYIPHQQCVRDQVSSCPGQNSVSLLFSQPFERYAVTSHCGFDMHFPAASDFEEFCVFNCHLWPFNEISLRVFYLVYLWLVDGHLLTWPFLWAQVGGETLWCLFLFI